MNKEYPNVLISFINSILKRDNPITSVELIGTEHDSVVELAEQMDDEFMGEHGIRLDLVGKTLTCEILNIVLRKQGDFLLEESKMQKKNDAILREQIVDSSEENNMYKRSLYYWAKLYTYISIKEKTKI